MPYEDSPFDSERDEVIVDVYADTELADVFDEVTPVKVNAEEFAAAIKVSNVMDVATERFGEIYGANAFEVLGNGITLDGDGESVRLLDKKTDAALATAEVVTVSKGPRATCKFAAVAGGIAKGAYTLEVTTFGLVGDTKPHVFRKPVTLVEAIPAPPTKEVEITDVTATRGEDTAYLTVKGVNLDGLRGWRVDEANDLHFKAEVFVNGTSQGEQEFYGPNVDPAQEQFGEITCVDFGVGDTVKVILRTDPAKTEFVQEEIVREVIVTQE